MTETVSQLTDYTVKIDDTSYSMLEAPNEASDLVKKEYDRTLKDVDLDKLVKNLDLTSDLLHLAYNSVPSKYGELRGSVDNLNDRFGKLCQECRVQLDALDEATRSIIPDLKYVFKFLLSNKEATAISFLQRAAAKAESLYKGMHKLAEDFKALGDDGVKAANEAQRLQGLEKQAIEEFERKTNELKAQTEQAEQLAKKLAESKNKLQKLYNEAKENATDAANKAFALQIVGAILAPIGQAAGAFAGAYMRATTMPPDLPQASPRAQAGGETRSKPQGGGDAPSTPAVGTGDTSKLVGGAPPAAKSKEQLEVERDAANSKLTEAQGRAETAKRELTAAQQQLTAAETAATEAKAGAKDDKDSKVVAAEAKKREATELVKTKTAAKTEAETAASQAASKYNELCEAVRSAGTAVSKTGENLGKVGDNMAEIAKSYREEKLKFFDLLQAKEDEEAKTLANIQLYAIQMKNMDVQKASAQVAAMALFQAISALKQIVVILRDAATFWENMANACKRLADADLKKNIEEFSKMEAEVKLDLYKARDFKVSVVTYMASWVALEKISKAYAAATDKVHSKVLQNYGTYLNDADAQALTKRLGEKLNIKAQEEQAAVSVKKIEIKAAQTATDKAAA